MQKITKAVGYAKQKPKFNFSDDDVRLFKNVAAVILALVATGGVITISAVAPNLIGAIGKLAGLRYKKRYFSQQEKKQKTIQAFYYLKKSGLIRFKKTSKEILLSLTKLGKQRAEKIAFSTVRVKKLNVWDKKWWLIAADIPTKTHRKSADLFRKKLKEMGLYTLQRTLWFYPFNPQAQIQFIAQYYGIEKYVTLMSVDKLDKEDESTLVGHFKKVGVL